MRVPNMNQAYRKILPFLAFLCVPAFAQNPTPITNPHVNLFDNSGNACAGCSLYTYAAGTTTPQVTYTSANSGGENTNPIVLDASGGAIIFTNYNAYKFVLKDTGGNVLWSVDNIVSVASLGCLVVNNVAYGCTGATTAQGAATNIVDGNTIKPSVVANASVNSQINVMAQPYGAKGDCTTDDHDAIQAAMNVQLTIAPQITVYFPAPPGGCYLTSTLNMTGASLQGQAGLGFLSITGGTRIKGKPGMDILHEPDPNTVSGQGTTQQGWSIRDLVFLVDDSTDSSGSFPHRWPGRWVQDGGMTATGHTFSSLYAEISCGDIGQNILVKGAGTGGSDLSTTISNVAPCWGNGGTPVVTLTAAASTTVTNALAYITPAGISLTEHVGNCAIAGDNQDGNSANWVIAGNKSNFQPSFYSVVFSSTTESATNKECAVYFGPSWTPYMWNAQFVTVWNIDYGLIFGTNDTNPDMAPGVGNDFNLFNHGWWNAVYPWISYNWGEGRLDHIQLTTRNGPQILKVKSTAEGAPTNWYINVPEFENGTGIGWRIEGQQNLVENTELCDGLTGYVETIISRFINTGCGGTLNMGGEGNQMDGGSAGATVNDLGMGNAVSGTYKGNTSSGMVPTVPMTATVNRGIQAWGTETHDFLRNGTLPYFGDKDLWFWPEDFTDSSGTVFTVTPDANSWTGKYLVVPSAHDFAYFNNAYILGRVASGSTNQVMIGSTLATGNVPAGPVTVEFSYKCPVITSFGWGFKAGGTSIGSGTASCSTTYQTAKLSGDFTTYDGQPVDFSVAAGEVDIAWMAIVPTATVTPVTVADYYFTFAGCAMAVSGNSFNCHASYNFSDMSPVVPTQPDANFFMSCQIVTGEDWGTSSNVNSQTTTTFDLVQNVDRYNSITATVTPVVWCHLHHN